MTADPAWRQQSGRARDVSGVLVRRRSTARKGIAWLVVVGVLLFVIISPMLDVLVKRMEILDLGTIVYQRAQWASTVALASWVAAAGALTAWLLGTTLRLAFGLPLGITGRWRKLFNIARVFLFMVLGWYLLVWSIEEMIIRKVAFAPQKALAMGLTLCLLLAYDIPRLLRRGMDCLRTRLPLIRVPKVPLAEIEAEGRILTRGRVVEVLGSAEELVPGVAYRCWEEGPPLPEREVHARAAPFIIEEGGVRAQVSADLEDLVVQGTELTDGINEQPDAGRGPTVLMELRQGDLVHVIADARIFGDGPYRQGALHLEAGTGPIYLFGTTGTMNRRLVLAGVVELLSAATLAACLLGLIGLWAYIGLIIPGNS